MIVFFRKNKSKSKKQRSVRRQKFKYQKKSKKCNFNNNITSVVSPPVSVVTIYLTNNGLIEYLQSTNGGKREGQSINQLLRRVEFYLNFIHSEIYKTSLFPLSFNVQKFFSEVIKIHYNLLPQFLVHMEKKKMLSVSSQLNYLYDIQKSVHWFVLFRRDNRVYFVKNLPYYRWLDCIRNLKKPLQHRLSLEKAKGNSLEEKVYQNQYPEGGLDQLQSCIKTEMEFVESLLSIFYIDKATYRRFMKILYSAIYAFGVQGRSFGNNNNIN